LATELAREVERLAAAGANFGALTANTPHIVFDEVERLSPIPLISIVRTALSGTLAAGIRRPALLGTRFTMAGRFYPEVFSRAGITLIAPAESEHGWIHDKYMNELVRGTFSGETRRRFVALIERMRAESAIDGAILAGTELPLLLRNERIEGVPLLDTTEIHVNAIVSSALE
ncbi:MAG TPA: amino acid racemase, partial [Thermoanaerobaculia bacterium]